MSKYKSLVTPNLNFRVLAGNCLAMAQGIVDRPESWADDRRIRLMASPGWAAAYASSQTARDQWDGEGAQPPQPGSDETAITDEMIADAVRAMVSAEAEMAHAAAMTTKEETIE